MKLTPDFETRSACDLKKAGAWVYSEHPTTEVICLWFCARNDKTFCWLPGDPEPPWLRQAIEDGAVFEAHNALFERAMWTNVMVRQWGWPEVPPEQWRDTMAVCARKALPLDLDKVSRLLSLPVVKDREGSDALKKIMKPNSKGEWNEDPDLYRQTIAYGETDTRAQMRLGKRLGELEPAELQVWFLNQRMNLRGLAVDLPFAADCQAVFNAATGPLDEEFQALVGCRAGQRDKVLGWIREQGIDFPNLTKETVEEALEGDLPDAVRTALELRGALTSASVKKLASMRACTSGDGRARGLIQYHAATTGRDGGRLLQPQNFPRGSVELGKDDDGNPVPPWEFLVPAIRSRDAAFIGDNLAHLETKVSEEYRALVAPVSAVTSALRHCLIPDPGNLFVSGDFSTIEVRVVLAIAGQTDKLDMIANGVDPYCDMAESIYRRPINKHDDPKERQDGKAAVLGLGFQMGVDKFWRKDFKDRPREVVENIVDIYRTKWAPNVKSLWYGLQDAATRTVWDRRPHEYNGIRYAIEDEWLTCRLPSGRKLYYFRPQKVRRRMPWSTEDNPDIRDGWTYLARKGGQLCTVDAYGGLLTENVVQATARDIMYDRALVADANGFPLVLTVHDELVTETPEAKADWPTLKEIMEEAPPWAKALGIPITAEGWTGHRYRK